MGVATIFEIGGGGGKLCQSEGFLKDCHVSLATCRLFA